MLAEYRTVVRFQNNVHIKCFEGDVRWIEVVVEKPSFTDDRANSRAAAVVNVSGADFKDDYTTDYSEELRRRRGKQTRIRECHSYELPIFDVCFKKLS